jgi:ubiquinone/menaquinone biosynthesis C-methylase UbiE
MSKKKVQEQFGAHAASYATSEVHAQGASLAKLLELVEPQPDWHMLDVATGAGHTAAAFGPFVESVVATDITLEMLAQTEKLAGARQLANISTETADAEALPYDDASFDLVTCRIAAHHFADIPAFIRESARVLRPAGILAVVDNIVPQGPVGDYINAFEKLRDPSHERCWSREEWHEELEKAGFSIVAQQELVKTINFDFWAQRHENHLRAYLKAMLSQASAAVLEFLNPQFNSEAVTFDLREGVFICRKQARIK